MTAPTANVEAPVKIWVTLLGGVIMPEWGEMVVRQDLRSLKALIDSSV